MPEHKLAMLLSNLRGDGAVGMMLALAQGFVERGYAVDVLATRADGERVSMIPDRVRLIDLRAPRPLRAVPSIVHYLRCERPKVLMASEHYSGLPALYALHLARTATRCIIRQDNTWGMDSQRFRGRHRWITPWAVSTLFRQAEIIAVSKGVADDLVAHFPRLVNNVQVIYNPVVSPATDRRARAAVDHRWFHPNGLPVVVAAGRLAAAKGFDLLIDAFARVVPVVPSRLFIMGEGPDRADLQSRINAYGLQDACELAGYQANPLAFMARASAFVLSSRFEGLPTVLIEALASGTRVIATNCPSGSNEILDGGKYGTLVPPENADALANAIVCTLQHPPTRNASLELWLQQFSVDASVAKHISLIQASLSALPPRLRSAPLRLDDNIAPQA